VEDNMVILYNGSKMKSAKNIFISGFSGSHKSTLATELEKQLTVKFAYIIEIDKFEEWTESDGNTILAKSISDIRRRYNLPTRTNLSNVDYAKWGSARIEWIKNLMSRKDFQFSKCPTLIFDGIQILSRYPEFVKSLPDIYDSPLLIMETSRITSAQHAYKRDSKSSSNQTFDSYYNNRKVQYDAIERQINDLSRSKKNVRIQSPIDIVKLYKGESAIKESATYKGDKVMKKFEHMDPTSIGNKFSKYLEEVKIGPSSGTTTPIASTQPSSNKVPSEPSNDAATSPTPDDKMINDHDNNPVEGIDEREEKNGKARKDKYESFIGAMKDINPKSTFSSVWDAEAFRSQFKFVPYEVRYFYRIANPSFVQIGEFKWIPYSEELIQAQSKYGLGKKLFVFATFGKEPVFFNMLDKKIYLNDSVISASFDGFIDELIAKGGIPVGSNEDLPDDSDEDDVEFEDDNPEDTIDSTEGDTAPPEEPEGGEDDPALESTDVFSMFEGYSISKEFGRFPDQQPKRKKKTQQLFVEQSDDDWLSDLFN
jgi:uridine kinase